MRSLRCSAAPSIWATPPPNLSPRSPTVTLGIVGASNAERMEESVAALESSGFSRIDELDGLREGDVVLGLVNARPAPLRDADPPSIRSVLAHDVDAAHHDRA